LPFAAIRAIIRARRRSQERAMSKDAHSPNAVKPSKLADAAGFSLDELAANRAGQMTEGQAAELWSRGLKDSWPAGLALIISTVFLIVRPTTIYSHNRPGVIHLVWDTNTTLFYMGLGLFIVLFLLVPLVVRGLDAHSKRALATEGPLSKFDHGGSAAHGIRVNGSGFRLTREAYEMLRDGWSCRVYYTPYNHELLSFELV
jgi:hypothetical protein